MYRIILTAMFAFLVCECYSQVIKADASKKGFLNSTSYRNYLSKYKNHDEILYSDKRFFNIIGEEPFLYNSGYSFYAIYLYAPKGDSALNIYVLKSFDGVTTFSMKKISNSKNLFYVKKNDKRIFQPFKIATSIKILTNNDYQNIGIFLEKSVKGIKDRLPSDSDQPFRFLFYFNGNEYYRISNYQVDNNTMTKLDSLFRKSRIIVR